MNKPPLVFLLLALALPAHADFSSSANGTTTADFLNLGVGARAAAMGGAYTAAADDATALYWNPAALARISGGSATLMHAPYIASSYFDYAAVAHDLGRFGAAAVGTQYFSPGSISATDASGESIGTVNPYDLAVSLGYAYSLNGTQTWLDGLCVGLAGKWVEQDIVTTASGFAADLGVLSPPLDNGRLTLGAIAQNMGPGMKLDSVNEPLPLVFKLGVAFRATSQWLLSLDAAAPRGGNPYAEVGTEYQLLQSGPWSFSLRAGYSSYTTSSVTGFTGASLGFGVGYDKGSVDYAFVPVGGLGQAQRISVTLRF